MVLCWAVIPVASSSLGFVKSFLVSHTRRLPQRYRTSSLFRCSRSPSFCQDSMLYTDTRSSEVPQIMGTSVDSILKTYDDIQAKLMDEECILIDKDDVKTGAASKKDCHLWTNIEKGMLHRAFSVFLFNTRGDLLLQQRALSKITYPGHWTNTCCSHPLNFETELDENNAVGVLRAAQRKLKHELGIEPDEVPLSSMHYLTRIHYKSENVPHDGLWGEHEIDYIIFAQHDVTLCLNQNEVNDTRYVTQKDLQTLVDDSKQDKVLLTPWFRLIVDKFLPTWWNNLSNLSPCLDRHTIHRMC